MCRTLIEANAIGGAAAMVCPQTGKPPLVYLYAVRWSVVTPEMVADFTALGLPGDSKERIRAMQAKYQTMNAWDMCDVWGPMRERVNAVYVALTPPVLPPPIWVVAKYSIQATRPTYYIHPGPVLSPAPDRARVGAWCDCTKTSLVVAGVQHCAFQDGVVNYQFTPVTVCVRP